MTRFPWEDDGTQPPPLQCQWCGADLSVGPHRPTCRVVTEVDELKIPEFLDRRMARGGHTTPRERS